MQATSEIRSFKVDESGIGTKTMRFASFCQFSEMVLLDSRRRSSQHPTQPQIMLSWIHPELRHVGIFTQIPFRIKFAASAQIV
ncbi:hypothetical protein BED46_040580 [Burkholderia contaminans]|uniref:EAL domain-containing protein n=1 Tax=Burkholderia contaminans LMG 23361 TaxID=1334628 RepID=A0ABD4AUQ2_9BURK|nr:hypothetical protein WR31_17855 [Burkholderia contaminans LMG 23361]ODN24663.1 hypothetical protein BGI28_03900 [Burkholderia contaminans]OMI77735.1 hypothetical protein BED46_040580 [Burkholderia contaminans]